MGVAASLSARFRLRLHRHRLNFRLQMAVLMLEQEPEEVLSLGFDLRLGLNCQESRWVAHSAQSRLQRSFEALLNNHLSRSAGLPNHLVCRPVYR